MLAEHLEAQLLLHADFLQAVDSVRRRPAPGTVRAALAHLDGFREAFRMLGFDLSASCAFRQLGLSAEFGPPPSFPLLAARTALARDLLGAAAVEPWGVGVATELGTMTAAIAAAEATCTAQMDRVLAARRRWSASQWPRWAELEGALLLEIARLAELEGRPLTALTQLSSLLSPVPARPGLEVPVPDAARQALDHLSGSAAAGAAW